jgi:hypothetical protein
MLNEMENKTPLTDKYLESLIGMGSDEPKDFFYSRLINRLENEKFQPAWIFPLKPVWMITTLIIFLVVNTVIITKKERVVSDESASIQIFANAYDQNVSSY